MHNEINTRRKWKSQDQRLHRRDHCGDDCCNGSGDCGAERRQHSTGVKFDELAYVTVFAKTALYEPAVGKTNVFGPGGIFPFFNDTFSCADNVLNCGVMAEGSTFKGVFREAGQEGDNRFIAEYTVPITYDDQQTAGHKYRVELVDTMWNNADPS